MSKYAVYDSVTGVVNFFDNLNDAEKDYEEAKENIMEDDLCGHEKVYLFEVKKIAKLVHDEEREKEDDPKKHGYIEWVKWKDERME